MEQQKALQNLIQAVGVAYEKGVYTMQEAHVLWDSITAFNPPQNGNPEENKKNENKKNENKKQ